MQATEVLAEPRSAVGSPAWKALESHYKKVRKLHLRKLFADDPSRGERLTASAAGIELDYSKNRITDETLELLFQLAKDAGLRERIDSEGQAIEMLASHHPEATEMDAYERVLGEAMAGDTTLFAREDYVEEAWRIVDPVLRADAPVYEYEPGTWGPVEASQSIVPCGGWHAPVIDGNTSAARRAA